MKRKIILYLVGAAYFVYHITTLDISPLPWFDETVFVDITRSFIQSGKFSFNAAAYFMGNHEVFEYGPLFFYFTSTVIQAVGLGVFQFRITSLFFGFLTILFFYKLLENAKVDKKIAFLSLMLFSLDPLFHSNMHGGRMDTMALAFVLISLLLVLRIPFFSRPLTAYLYSLLSGSFAAAAILTTPRSGILLISISFLLLFRWLSSKKQKYFLSGLCWTVPLVGFYLIWFFYAFGNVSELFNTYKTISEESYVSFFVPLFQIPLIAVTSIVVIYGIMKRGKEFFSEIKAVSLGSIIFFYFLVSDTGTYSVFIVPFYYLVIAGELSFEIPGKYKIQLMPVCILLAVNAGIFLFKSTVLFSNYTERDPEVMHTFIANCIPSGSRVIGDEMYYYAVTGTNSEFEYMHLYADAGTREKYQREVFDYDYIIWSERLQQIDPDLLKKYESNSRLVEVSHYTSKKTSSLFFRNVGLNIIDNYNCIVYKRVK